eukprot:3759875-Pleurochrysis_carterae.AAC.1
MAPRYEPERWRDTHRYQMHVNLARAVAEAETSASREALRARIHADQINFSLSRAQNQSRATSSVPRQTQAL